MIMAVVAVAVEVVAVREARIIISREIIGITRGAIATTIIVALVVAVVAVQLLDSSSNRAMVDIGSKEITPTSNSSSLPTIITRDIIV